MKKILTITTIILLTLSIPAYALFNSDVKKAKEFIKADMYPQAIELLNKRINEKPTDLEAHFVLGTCYLQQGNIGMAEQRFDSAVKLEPKYGIKVATELQKAGDVRLNQDKLSRARKLYSKAIKYNPDLRGQIAQTCFDRGSASLSKSHFDAAIKIDPAYKMRAYNLIMDKADAASDDACLKFYKMALGYCGKGCERTQKAGKRLEAIAAKLELKDIEDPLVEHLLLQAQKMADGIRSYVVTYNIGDSPILSYSKKGEITPYWFKFTDESSIELFDTNQNYEILVKGGPSIKIYRGEMLPKKNGRLLQDKSF